MSPFRSRTDGSHYPLTKRRRGLYGAPHHEKYSEILSGIHTQSDAEEASKTMLGEFHGAKERQKQVRVKRALVQRMNRARVASTNKNLSPEVREREGKIAEVFYRAEKQMVIPAKNDPPSPVANLFPDTGEKTTPKWNIYEGNEIAYVTASDRIAQEVRDKKGQYAKGKWHVEPIISKSEKHAEKAMVKDEHKGESEYLKMAAEAEKEGRSQDAKVFREHAADEKRHGREDAKIVHDSQVRNTATTKNVDWNEAMRKNTAYLGWAKNEYPNEAKDFVIPNDVDNYRKSRGLGERPNQFRV